MRKEIPEAELRKAPVVLYMITQHGCPACLASYKPVRAAAKKAHVPLVEGDILELPPLDGKVKATPAFYLMKREGRTNKGILLGSRTGRVDDPGEFMAWIESSKLS